MFNVVHQGRKYVPTRSSVTDDSPLAVRTVHVNKSPGKLNEAPEATWPPPGAKMRISKASKGAVVVRAVRRHQSPQPASLESLEAAWSDRGHSEVKPPESSPSHERRNGQPEASGDGMEGGPPRSRKKGFRPPDVRTIFSERDPRVKEESGEGHTFEPGGENTWCDVCCYYIFQHGLTCAGESAVRGVCVGGWWWWWEGGLPRWGAPSEDVLRLIWRSNLVRGLRFDDDLKQMYLWCLQSAFNGNLIWPKFNKSSCFSSLDRLFNFYNKSIINKHLKH